MNYNLGKILPKNSVSYINPNIPTSAPLSPLSPELPWIPCAPFQIIHENRRTKNITYKQEDDNENVFDISAMWFIFPFLA